MKSGLTTRLSATVACAFLLVLGSSSFTYATSLKSLNLVSINSSYTHILWHNYSEGEIEELKQVFTLFDKNGDTTIIPNELWAVLRTLGKNKTIPEVEEMIAKFDANGNGTLEFPEFLELMWHNALDS